MPKRSKGYRNGVRIVRFPGGRVARFHKPGTVAYAKGAAKKRRLGKWLAKHFGIKKRRGYGKTRRNPGKASRDTRTGPPRAVRAPDFIYHSSVPASQRTLWVVAGTDYGYLHTAAGDIRTWKTRSGAAKKAKEMRSWY